MLTSNVMKDMKWMDGAVSLELLDLIFTNVITVAKWVAGAPLLVAIDTESSDKGRLSELGISTFDPRCLHHLENHSDSLNNAIATFYYAKGGSKDRTNYKPYRLGTPQPRLRNEDLQRILDTHLKPKDLDGKARRVILIGQNITHDLKLIKNCSGINIECIPNITAILDTQIIAPRALQFPSNPGLKIILKHLKLDFIGLHNAGHDSRYTLRAALILFAMYRQQLTMKLQDQSEVLTSMIGLVEGVARSHKVNERRKWTPPVKTKLAPAPVPDIFSHQDFENVEVGGIMALFE